MIKRMDINNFCKMIGCKNKKHLISELPYLKVNEYSWCFNDANGVEVILIDYRNSIYIVRSRWNCYLEREYDEVRICERKYRPLDSTPYDLLENKRFYIKENKIWKELKRQ